MYSERIINVHGFCILPMGLACLCNILQVINVVITFMFGYLLTFTHNLYILLGGLLHSVNTEAGTVPAPGILPVSPM